MRPSRSRARRSAHAASGSAMARCKWRTIHYALYGKVRDEVGREPQPSLLIVDSQRVKTGKVTSNKSKGFDGGKHQGVQALCLA